MVKGLPLSSLPDGCILNLMTQLPPLARMHLAATCVRYQQIYKFGRLHSLVLSNSSESPPLGHLLSCADGCFPTLASAIHNSRPGETIMVAAGVHEAADIMVSHPIRIIGAGSSDSAVLSCDVPGATAAISFQSSGEVSNLAVRSKKAACISARGGSSLWVKDCSLSCDAGGLPHLYSAIITSQPGCGFSSPQERLAVAPPAVASRGSIIVSETYVEGGIKAEGLQSVRCIARGDRAALWFEIRHLALPSRRASQPRVRAAWTAVQSCASSGPAALQLPGKRKAVDMDDAAAEALLDERAEAWAAQHARKRVTGH